MRKSQDDEDVAALSERCHPRWEDSEVVGQDRKTRKRNGKDVRYAAFEDVLLHVSMVCHRYDGSLTW